MTRRVVVVGAVLVAAIAAGAYLSLRSSLPDLGPSPPHRDLVPRSLVYFAEAKDLRGLWGRLRATESWKDLAGSKLVAHLRDEPGVKDLLAAVEQASQRVGYPVDGDNAMKFLGRETSFGVSLPASGGPEAVLLARLDVDALAKDLLARQADWRELMDELARRSGKLDFQVTTSPHATPRGPVTVARLERHGNDTYLALCGDSLVLATDRALCGSVIDLFAADGAGGLGSDPRFRDEAAKFSAAPALLEWFDLEQLAARRSSIGDLLRAREAPPEAVAAVDHVLAGVQGGGSVARATELPDGDLYRLHWRWSKGPEMFGDAASPSMPDVLAGDWIAWAEARDAGRVVDAWDRSALRRKLGAGEIGRQIDRWLAEPTSALDRWEELGLPAQFGEPETAIDWEEESGEESMEPEEDADDEAMDEEEDADDDFDDPDAPPSEDDPRMEIENDLPGAGPDDGAGALDLVDPFLWRMATHVARTQFDALLAGDAAFAVDWSGEEDAVPRFAAAIRLDVDGRLAALAVEGALREKLKSVVDTTAHGGREIRTWTDDAPGSRPLHWTRIGDVVLVSNDLAEVRRAIDRAAQPVPAPEAGRAVAVAAKLRPGWCAYLHVDVARLEAAAGRLGRTDAEAQSVAAMLSSMRTIDALPMHFGCAAYVAEDLSRIEMLGAGEMSPRDPAAAGPEPADGPPAWRTWLPPSTIAYGGGVRAFTDFWNGFDVGMRNAGGDRGEMDRAFRDATGMDLEKEVRPAFGEAAFAALTYRPAKPARGGPGAGSEPPVAIPGIVLGLGVRDEAAVRRLLDRGVELLHEAVRESEPGRGDVVAKEPFDGLDVRVAKFTAEEAEEVPVRPALALGEGWLLLASEVEVLHGMIDVRRGRGAGIATTAPFTRAAATLASPVYEERYLDGGLLLDEIREMAPMLASAFGPGPSVPFPEYPEDGDEEEWDRRMAKYQEDVARARGGSTEETNRWIDAFRVVESASSSVHREGRTFRFVGAIEFAR